MYKTSKSDLTRWLKQGTTPDYYQFITSRGFLFLQDVPINEIRTAIELVILETLEYRLGYFNDAKDYFRADMHKAINDKNHIPKLLNGSRAYYKLRELNNFRFAVNYVAQNATVFDKNLNLVNAWDLTISLENRPVKAIDT